MEYELLVDFDDIMDNLFEKRKRLLEFIDKYHAEGMCHDNGSTSLKFYSEKSLDRTQLQKDLGDIAILEIEFKEGCKIRER